MSIITISFVFFLLMPSVLLVVLWFVRPKLIQPIDLTGAEKPFISILIAARNEELNLPELFQSLKELNYPKDKFEILFGDDQSEDTSSQLIQDFCKEVSNAQYYLIEPTNKQIAKANVLMQLTQKAEGELYYFLDADMRPNTEILKSYASLFQSDLVGITGVTLPESKDVATGWQRIDWGFALGMLAASESLGHPTTAMGNNMVLRKSDYDRVGGYERLPQSTVEDFTLYKAVIKNGSSFPVQFSNKLLAKTKPMKTIKELLQQRKRWMLGGMQVQWFLKGILAWQGVFYPVMLLFCFLNPILAVQLWMLKWSVQFVYHVLIFVRLRQKTDLFAFLTYEIYNTAFTCLLLVFYLLPTKIVWKGRSYGNH